MLDHAITVGQQQPFGDFHHHTVTGHAKRAQLLDPGRVQGVGVFKLHRRLVDADLKLGVQRGAPALHLGCRLGKHPFADVHNQSAAFCHRNELCRADQSTRGVLPAYQCLGFVNGAIGQFHNRLVNHPEFFSHQCRAHVVGELCAQPGRLLQGGCKKAEAVAPGTLGHVKRLVGIFQQVFYFETIAGVNGDPNAGRHKHLVQTQLERGAQGVQQFGQDALQMRSISQVRDDHRELVTTHAGHSVNLTQAVLNAPGSFGQQQVAPVMAQGVIDFLEVVQVDEQQRQLQAVTATFFEFLRQPLLHHAPVRQAGQGIKMGLLPDLGFSPLALGDVGVGADHAQRQALCVALNHHAPAVHPFPAAVLAAHPVFIAVGRGQSVQVGLTVMAHARQVIGVSLVV